MGLLLYSSVLVCFTAIIAASTAGIVPAVDEIAACERQAVSAPSFARRASIVGFNTSLTPGIASTLSNNWLSDGKHALNDRAIVVSICAVIITPPFLGVSLAARPCGEANRSLS